MKHAEVFKVKLDKKSRYPAYLRLAEVLRKKIENGELKENDFFPEEREYCKILGISRPTLRRAFEILKKEGYIYTIWGKGVFVAKKNKPLDMAQNNELIFHGQKMVGISFYQTTEDSNPVTTAKGIISYLCEKNIRAIRFNGIDNDDLKEHIKLNHLFLYGQIMFCSIVPGHKEIINFSTSLGIPLVLINNYFPDIEIDSVTADCEQGSYETTKHFIAAGHKKIAFFAYQLRDISPRRAGYKKAMLEAGLEQQVIDLELKKPQLTFTTAAYDIGQYFNSTQWPTAVLAENDSIAIGIYKAFQMLDINFPKDIELIGFGDESVAPFLFAGNKSPISTVAIPWQKLGQKAASLLLKKINNINHKTQHIKLPTKIIHRSTTRQHKT